MTILVITIYWYFKICRLSTTFTRNRLTLRVLLRKQCLNLQLAKLQICLHSKQRTTSAYQTTIQIHRYITRLYRLNNIILLTLVVQLQIHLIKAKRRLCIISHIQIQLITHLTIDVHLNLFVKIKYVVITITLRQ